MARKRRTRAHLDAERDMAEDFPRLYPLDQTTQRTYKGQAVDWYVAYALKELDKIDRQEQIAAQRSENPVVFDPLNAILAQLNINRDDEDRCLTPVTMKQLINLLPEDQMVCVGSNVGYFFMGTITEYKKTISTIEKRYELSMAFNPWNHLLFYSGIPFSDRFVKQVFTRSLPGEPVMMAISLEGKEIAPFSLYQEFKQALSNDWLHSI